MTPEEIEKEVQARVEFKMNEFMTGLKNVAMQHWNTAFANTSQKYQHYWEAFEQVEGMIKKEMYMPTPYDDMAKRAKWEAKETAVNNIRKELENKFRGTLRGPDFEMLIRRIVTEVEKAQNF